MLRISKCEIYEPQLEPGDCLVAINGHSINDLLDFKYHATDDFLKLQIRKIDGTTEEIEYNASEFGPLELEFEPDPIKRCRNKCIFCFIHQLPRGLRKSLYLKDEDYRHSFLHGNYITLTNLDETDFERIIEMRLSPLYISVHATDENLRAYMLGKKNLPRLKPQLERLVSAGIDLHTQIVVCPRINDGVHLEKTVNDLSKMYPRLNSVAVVPVGLTAHRKHLAELNPVTPSIAVRVLDQVAEMQTACLERIGCRFVYPADEWFIVAERDIPPRGYYEGFPQIEDGVGMLRQLFSSRKLPPLRLAKKIKAVVVTGTLMKDILPQVLTQKLERVENFEVTVSAVENKLLGESITVSGLLGGGDIYRSLRSQKSRFDVILLPPNCLNSERRFLDDWRPEDISSKLNIPVVVGCYSPYTTVMPILRRYT